MQVLQRPGPFSLRDFHFAAQKLHAAATLGSAEPQKTGQLPPSASNASCQLPCCPVVDCVCEHHSRCWDADLYQARCRIVMASNLDSYHAGLALKSLIAHLAGRKGLPVPVQTTVCLLGHVFSHDAFRRAIADASRASIRLQFVALVPTVDSGI